MFEKQPNCPDCASPELDRRGFIGTGVSLLAVGAMGTVPAALKAQQAAAPASRKARPAEVLIQELYASMSEAQKRTLVLPWNDRRRIGMYNASLPGIPNIGDGYTPAQIELNQRILQAISSGEEGYFKLTREGTFDGSGSFNNCGAYIFGQPGNNRQYAWVFAGHHITVRCDGNSEPGAAFGGPMYYGHSPDGYSARNCFNFQTRSVMSVYEALNENQRQQAIVVGTPGELEPSIRFRAAGQPMPGISGRDLSADQRRLVESVMRTVLSPYRREDADEVMDIVRHNGGMERIHLAFYREQAGNDSARYHFWRLEGPGFVWNYRVLPHVHTYVNIAQV